MVFYSCDLLIHYFDGNILKEINFVRDFQKLYKMNRIIFLLIMAMPFLIKAQKPTKLVENKSDTIITKDPLNKDHDYWEIHNMKGNIQAQGFVFQGKKDGVWREYNDGNAALNKIAEYKEGVLNGASITISTSGSVQSEETYINGKKNGQRRTYSYFGGRLKMSETYKDDALDGMKKIFYEEGNIQEEGYYKNGKRDGVVKWYLENGNLSMEYLYKNGELEGVAKAYDENGKLKQEGSYLNNFEEGEWKEYKDSVLVKKIFYKKGQILREVPVKK